MGTHSWEVLEPASGSTFPLPQGGIGNFVGAYPEIQSYMLSHDKKNIQLTYNQALDKFTPDYSKGEYEWRFFRSDDEVIVRDISRVVASFTIGT
jgi:hypothetical protein